MEYEIIIRDKKNNELVRQIVPETCLIAISKIEYPFKQTGWKKKVQIWNNLNDDEKKRMLEHSTF